MLRDYICCTNKCRDPNAKNVPEIIVGKRPKDKKERETGLSYPSFVLTLVKQTEVYHEDFIDLVEEMVAKMKDANVGLESVKLYCKILLSNPSLTLYAEEMKKELELIVNFEKLKEFLHDQLCSWYNYQIIAKLWKKLLVASDNTKLSEYEDKIQTWVKRRVFKFVKDFGPNTNGSHIVEVRCKVDVPFNDTTYPKLVTIQDKFFDCVPKEFHHLIHLKCVIDGCLELVFRAPVDIEDIKLTSESERVLRENKFKWIKIGEKLLLEDNEDNHSIEVLNNVGPNSLVAAIYNLPYSPYFPHYYSLVDFLIEGGGQKG